MPGRGRQVEEAFNFGNGEWDQARVAGWLVVGLAGAGGRVEVASRIACTGQRMPATSWRNTWLNQPEWPGWEDANPPRLGDCRSLVTLRLVRELLAQAVSRTEGEGLRGGRLPADGDPLPV